MKLLYRIMIRLVLVLLPLMAAWAGLFYFRIVEEVNDDADDALEDYAELIIVRHLSGQPLPDTDSGSNNSYTVTPVDAAYAALHPGIAYFDAEVYIPEKGETEPARILSMIFEGRERRLYELRVAMPTFEKDDLVETIWTWVVLLFGALLLTVLVLVLWIFYRGLKPLYALLNWLDDYRPGHRAEPVPNDTSIREFRRLNAAAQQAVERSEALVEQQKQFIGNASHELQTPLAVLGGRLEWMLDKGSLTEAQMQEVAEMLRTQRHIVRLNRDLLLLTKIDNGQFPESEDVDVAALLRESCATYDDIYAERAIRCTLRLPDAFVVRMNPSLASVLTTNLLRNAYLHSAPGAHVEAAIEGRTLTIANDGAAPLDAGRIFERFYQGSKREGSTGLGLALAKAAAGSYGLRIDYRFEQGRHLFAVTWPDAESRRATQLP